MTTRKIISIDEGKCNGCGGLCRIVEQAIRASGRNVPVKEITISITGKVIAEQEWQ